MGNCFPKHDLDLERLQPLWYSTLCHGVTVVACQVRTQLIVSLWILLHALPSVRVFSHLRRYNQHSNFVPLFLTLYLFLSGVQTACDMCNVCRTYPFEFLSVTAHFQIFLNLPGVEKILREDLCITLSSHQLGFWIKKKIVLATHHLLLHPRALSGSKTKHSCCSPSQKQGVF